MRDMLKEKIFANWQGVLLLLSVFVFAVFLISVNIAKADEDTQTSGLDIIDRKDETVFDNKKENADFTITENESITPDETDTDEYHWVTPVPEGYTGLALEEDGTWYYLENGSPALYYTNLVLYNGKWFYVENGILDWDADTLTRLDGRGDWYKVKNGTIDWDYTGLTYFQVTNNWYYIKNGVIDWSFTGLSFINDNWWYVKKGMIDWNYRGLFYYFSSWWYINGGKIDWSYCNLVQNYGMWFYIDHGAINWNTCTLAQVNGNGQWYKVTNGMIDWDYNGLFFYSNTWFNITNGQVNWNDNLVLGWDNVWYYVSGGYIKWNYTGLVRYGSDWWYVQDSILKWGYYGKVKHPFEDREIDVENSRAILGKGGLSPEVEQKARNVLNAVGNHLWGAYQWAQMQYETNAADSNIRVDVYANYGLTYHKGNCYVMAGTLVALARTLGYEAYQISGGVRNRYGGLSPHSWAEIYIDGAFYIFDPDFAWETGRSGWQLYYGQPGTWQYAEYYRMGS